MVGAPNVSREEFARNLADSGLSGSVDLPAGGGDGTAAAGALVAAGALTRFQAEAVLARRFADLRVGNYEILDRLGAGGMGTVFKARHRRMKRVVALKVLSKEVAGSDKLASRFQREVEMIARLTHPNIVMAFDADEGETGPFLVMEFVDGKDLAAEVHARGPLPPLDAIDRVLQAARGLEYAHAHGVTHRDIKPGNVLRDAAGVVKVADLGLARLTTAAAADGSTSLTLAGSVVGTVDYMSPEQAVDSGTVDHRADVYSLGCTLYFLLTGRVPYPAASIMAVMLKHRDAPIPYVCDARPDVPPALDAVFRKMVAKRPDDRFPTMAAVAAALGEVQRAVKSQPAHADTLLHAAAPPTDQTADFASPLAAAQVSTGFELGPAAAAAPAPAPTVDVAGRLAGVAAVVAEPSRTQASIIRSYLQQLGATAAHTTGSGRDVIDAVKRAGAGVVVSSLHLSDMTGVALAAALRADPACAGVGFVLATSASDADATAALPRDPRTTVMPKPFDLGALAAAVATVLG